MITKKHIILIIILAINIRCLGLEPNEILVIANGDNAESIKLAQYYCQKRGVPEDNILKLSLGEKLRDTISRNDYDKWVVEPIREELTSSLDRGRIRCLLTTYGVPYKISRRGMLEGQGDRIKELRRLLSEENKALEELETQDRKESTEYKQRKLTADSYQAQINLINGVETEASVDSELSMVMFGNYELYRWQPNLLKRDNNVFGPMTYMVSRLDGPGFDIAVGLIDKAIKAEQNGLAGVVYIDSRDIKTKDTYGQYDQSLRDLALLARLRLRMSVDENRSPTVYQKGECPYTAIYCGWYSVGKYIDAFKFVDGAIGYHIASYEAMELRDPNSTEWCPAMLKDGITATLGPVREPYLNAFPLPRMFFLELFNGACLVEAYYYTKPFNSWQMLLIGDPLYRPFTVTESQPQTNLLQRP